MQGPAISQATVTTAEPRRAPTPGSPASIRTQGPPYASPSLYPQTDPHATTDLAQRDPRRPGDVARLLALHQHAIARGWLQGGEAAQLNVVAAAVHARRVGDAPCRLFVALLRDQRWEVITQEDEDQARRLLREHRDGPPHAREASRRAGGGVV